MRQYETLCVLHPELPETRIKELVARMQKIIEGMKGQVKRVDEWGGQDLSYRIRKQRRGYYVRLEYEAEPQALSELERNLKLSEDVLRFMSVRKEVDQKGPVVQAAREPAMEEKGAVPGTEPETAPQPSQTPQGPSV